MEWVETTGRTLDEAKERALDQLGVDEAEAEFEVIEEAKAGLFGRVRREARVRARVRPTQPRPKVDRRSRKRAPAKSAARGGKAGGNSGKGRGGGSTTAATATLEVDGNDAGAQAAEAPAKVGKQNGRRRRGAGSGAGRTSGGSDETEKGAAGANEGEPTVTTDPVTLDEQGDIVEGFLEGLLDAFELDGEVTRESIDDEMLELRVEGDDLGLLIGPKGQTLAALQELSRTVVHRQAPGGHEGRFRLDVSGYRQRRREALERFTRTVAEEVKASGTQKALEPMGSADRKVVHDTVNEIDGVSTVSEGEDPRRRVVIVPES